MKVGIISDTHDNLPKVKKAVALFNSRKAGYVLHAGDFVAPFVIPVLDGLRCPWAGVFGNNDGEKKGLAECSNGRIKEGPAEFSLDGKRLYVAHSISAEGEEELAASGKYDVIISGHTHRPLVKRINGVLMINPGECSGWLYGKSSVAIVDSTTLDARMYRV